MYCNAIKYKGLWLAPGCHAFQLYQDGKFEELDKHIKQVMAKGKR